MKKDISRAIKPIIAFILLISVSFSAVMFYEYNKLAKELFLHQHGVRLTGAVQAMLEEAYGMALSTYSQNKKELIGDAEAMLEASIGIVRGGDILTDSYIYDAANKMEAVVAQMERLESALTSLDAIEANKTINQIFVDKKAIAALLERFEGNRWNLVTTGHAELLERLDYIKIALLAMNLMLGLLVGALWYSDRQKEASKQEILELNKNLEEAVAEQTTKLREMSESKSVFLSNISHDIKTPLNSIIGHSTLLLEESFADEKKKKKLEAILGSANYILELSSDMMDISRIESGKIKLYYEKFNLEELRTNINALFASVAAQKGVAFTVLSDIEETAAAYGDKQKILRILCNLTANAIKFTPKDGFVEVAIKKSGENIYAFEIKDSGRGIPREYLSRIFEPFFQINLDGRGGNGLGLFIVKSYLEAMGSEIKVESEEEKGSVFYFSLTLEPAPGAPILKKSEEPTYKISSYEGEPALEEEIKNSILDAARLGHTSVLKQNIARVKSEPLKNRLLYFAELFDMAMIAKEIETFEKTKETKV